MKFFGALAITLVSVDVEAAALRLRHPARLPPDFNLLVDPIIAKYRLKPNGTARAPEGAPGETELEVARKQAKKTLQRVKEVDLPGMVRDDYQRIMEWFLPGWRFRMDIFLESGAVIATGLIWITVWLRNIYENDRPESLARWGKEVEAITEDNCPAAYTELRPDLIVVFHHPRFPMKDRAHHTSVAKLHRTLVAEVDTWRVLGEPGEEVDVRHAPAFHAEQVSTKKSGDTLRGHQEDGWVALADEPGYVPVFAESSDSRLLEPLVAQPSSVFGRFRSLMKTSRVCELMMSPTMRRLRKPHSGLGHQHQHGSSAAGSQSHPKEEPPTIGEARVALLQDLYAALPWWGFDAHIFSSIDDDEIYVCISLVNMEAMTSYLLRHGTLLQIRQDVVARLGILQPPEEPASSPPLMRYDPRIVEKLHQRGILPANDPHELYHAHHGRSKRGCIANGKERFRMIFKELCTQLDLDAAKHERLIVDWYPAHSRLWLVKLTATWASFKRLHDFSFVQPVPLINDYFGARVAFNFAWNGLYCKALLALSIFAIAVEVGIVLLRDAFGAERVHKRVVLACGIVNIIWARVACNLWDREQEFFMRAWELSPEGLDHDQTIRPSFFGERQPSPKDMNVMEKQYPASKAFSRKTLSTLITLVFCALVAMCIVVWTNIFQGDMNIVASICLAVQIQVFQFIYNFMVPCLTDWENHKFQCSYYDSVLLKQFMFQSVNSYSAFLYIAIQQRYTKFGCPEGGCLAVLRTQLSLTLLMLSVARIAQVVIESLVVRFKIWYEDYYLKQSKKDEVPDERSFAELQSKFAEARLQEQIQNMLQLMLSLGFVLLFGCVAPIIVPFGLAVFTVQLRATAFMLLNYTKRTLPRQQFGIGLWRDILSFVMQASVLFSGFLIVVYGDQFAGTPTLARLAGFIVYVLIARLLWLLVDIAVPKSTLDAEILRARRSWVQNVIMQRSETYGVEAVGTPTAGAACPAHLASEVEAGNWGRIPHLRSAEYKWH